MVRNRLAATALALLLVGVLFLLIENIFYQYVDEDGVLHESLFLPLGVTALVTGFLLGCYVALRMSKLRKDLSGDKSFPHGKTRKSGD